MALIQTIIKARGRKSRFLCYLWADSAIFVHMDKVSGVLTLMCLENTKDRVELVTSRPVIGIVSVDKLADDF